ncbi:MAG: hypothetical protein RR909_02220 [Bacilli bacterium]
MKYLLFIHVEQTEETEALMAELKAEKYNAFVSATTSLKHLNENDEDNKTFLSLQALTHLFDSTPSLTMHMVVEEDEAEHIRTLVENYTHNFTTTKGCVFAVKIDKFEGSF